MTNIAFAIVNRSKTIFLPIFASNIYSVNKLHIIFIGFAVFP